MSTKQKLLLPLYYVRKQTRSGLNERNLIFILLISTVLTLIVIFKHLPTNVNLAGDELNNIFVPRLNKSNYHDIIHNVDQDIHKHLFKAGLNLDQNPSPNLAIFDQKI